MAKDRDEQPIRVARIDDNLRNLLAVAQAQMRPSLPGIRRLVDSVARGQVGPWQTFAAADVDDIRIGGRDCNRADRSGRLVVKDRLPRPPVIGCLPHAAVAHADVEDIRLAGNAAHRFGPPAAIWADRTPAHLTIRSWCQIAGLGRSKKWRSGMAPPEQLRREGACVSWFILRGKCQKCSPVYTIDSHESAGIWIYVFQPCDSLQLKWPAGTWIMKKRGFQSGTVPF